MSARAAVPAFKERRSVWSSLPEIQKALTVTVRANVPARIWQRDASVWKPAGQQQEISNRLGWLDAPAKAAQLLPDVLAFAEEAKRERVTHVVLMGMGGSSLAPEVFQAVFGPRKGHPRLVLLDSTDPERVRDVRKQINLKKSLFVFASKSGTTTEPFSFFKYFWREAERALGRRAGSRFVAITDPGTSLEALALEKGFRRTFLADPDVGGRYSALTLFGLVPAALCGIDVAGVVERARKCASHTHSADTRNPALALGVGMASLSLFGRDKLTIVAPPDFEIFGDWAEQLVAESTGKEGKGIVPVVGEPLGRPEQYGPDRFFVVFEAAWDRGRDAAERASRIDAIEEAGFPIFRIPLKDRLDLGTEFFRWQMATAVAGSQLGINPFDQPDVQSAKDQTKQLLREVEGGRAISPKTSGVPQAKFRAAFSSALGAESPWRTLWSTLRYTDGIHVLAFLPDRREHRELLRRLRSDLRDATRLAVTASFGPRYLHSSGQLHKGGAANGVFFVVTAKRRGRLPVPGDKFSFEELELAQAVGDFRALEAKGRRAAFLQLPDLSRSSVASLRDAFLKAAKESLRPKK